MKKFPILILLLTFGVLSNVDAQWTEAGNYVTLSSSSKNVGIGIAAPTYKLEVNGPTKIFGGQELQIDNADISFLFHDPGDIIYSMGVDVSDSRKFKIGNGAGIGDNTFFTMTTDGKIGIGESSPNAKLEVNGNQRITNEIRFKNTTTLKGLVWGASNWTATYSRVDDYGGNLYVMTDDYFYLAGINSSTGAPGNKTLTANTATGTVGIGTETLDPAFKLLVNGKIKAEEIQVVVDVPADYVFEDNYYLKPLAEVEAYIKEKHHLPGIPSADEIKEQGWQVGEMNNKLLEKVEELTLYMIELKKENEEMRQEIDQLKKKIK
ncbi:MAG: hypothetical protein ACMVP2_20575 [Imperialibacter sp.]|uniref:hypothetical protein n=1 Tax=Imperialibacter sp. TaxID=2038411 RepID=UPI003A85912D